MALAVGAGAAGLAHRVLGDGAEVPRQPSSTSTAAAWTCASRTTRTSRPSRGRPASAFASTWMHNAWITTAGEKMSKSLGNSLTIPAVLERARAIDLRFYIVVGALPLARRVLRPGARGARGRVPADRALPRPGRPKCSAGSGRDAVRGLRQRDGRRPGRPGRRRGDLRGGARGQQAPGRRRLGRAAGSRRRRSARCSRCWGWTRSTRTGPGAAASATRSGCASAVDALVGDAAGAAPGSARAAKDFATADAIRDRIKAAGIEVEDTPSGPSWSLG